jgi:hypothetical protein
MADKAQIIVEAVDKASGVLNNIGGAISNVAKLAAGAAVAGVAALGAGIAKSISVAGEFEATMNRFAAVTGTAVKDAGMSMEDFNKLALDMGAKTQFSAQEAGAAMVELAKGGIDVATIKAGGLEAALALAAAGELDLAMAAEITAKQLGVWSSQGVTAAQVADRMAQAANASTVNVDDLAIGMANVGGVAKIAGLSFDETTQAMALLAPGFSSASDAGTSFKAFLNNLIPTTTAAKSAASELGLMTFNTEKAIRALATAGIDASKMSMPQMIEAMANVGKQTGMTKKEIGEWIDQMNTSVFYDAQGQFVGMEKAAMMLHEATKGLTQEQRSLAFETIFGADAQRAAAIIAEQGAAGYNKMGDSMDAAGDATSQAAARQQGFAFAMESLKGSIETLMIVIGQKFLPIATEIINKFVIPTVNGFMAVVQAADPLIAFLTKDSAIGFQTFFNAMSVAFGPTAATKIGDFVKNAKDVITGLTAWLSGDAFGTGSTMLSMALSKMFGPETAGAIVTFINNAKSLIQGFIGWLDGSIAGNVNFALALMDIFGPETGKVVWDFVNGVRSAISGVVNWIQTNWPAIQTTISGVIDAIGGYINTVLIPVIGAIIGKAGEVVAFIQANWPLIQAAFQSVIDWVKTNWPNISQIISDVVTAVKDILTNVLIPIFAGVIAAAGLLVKWIVENWPAIREVIKFIVDAVVKKLDEMKKTILLAFDQAKAIGNLIGEIKTAVETKWAEIQKFVEGLPAAFVAAGQNIIQGLINGVVSKLKAFGDLWAKLSSDPINTLKEVMDMHSPSQVMYEAGENIMKGLIYGVLSYRNKAVNMMESTAQAIQGAATDIYQTPAVTGSVAAGDDAFDRGSGRMGGALVPSMAAAGGAMAGSLPQGFNATINVQLMLDGAVLAATVVSIVQGVLQQEKQRYG